MEVNNPQNHSYWFVVRENQSNVIFSSNNFTVQNPQITGQEPRYGTDTSENHQYVQDVDGSAVVQDLAKIYDNESNNPPRRNDASWDVNKIKLLLTLCLDTRFKSDSNEMMWNEISLLIGTTPDECDKKYRSLRRIYIRLLKNKRLGKKIKWMFFNMCEDVFKDCKTLSSATLDPWEDAKVRKLLGLYIENLNKFQSSDCRQKDIWKEIASQLNTTDYNCYHKFKNLKRTYFNWLDKSGESGKVVKWPYHHYFERIFYNYKPNIGPWDKNKIKLLINAYAEIAGRFKDPKFQKKELWREISRKVGETPSNCDRKFRNLKQTYLRLKIRVDSGRSVTKWRYYKEFQSIFENPAFSITDDGQNIVYIPHHQDYVKQLLLFYIENKEKFKDPLVKKKRLWRMISPKLGISPEECDKKFRNLKQTFMRLVEKKRRTGKVNCWKYYSDFVQIYDEPLNAECNYSCNLGDVNLSDIKPVVNAQDNQDRDKFGRLIKTIEESNNLQRERNKILKALLDRNSFN